MSIESPISSNEKPKQIIALHGLCGAPEDWSIVASLLPPGFKLIAADSFSSDWIKILTATPDSKIILAHSWAAYLFFTKGLSPRAVY